MLCSRLPSLKAIAHCLKKLECKTHTNITQHLDFPTHVRLLLPIAMAFISYVFVGLVYRLYPLRPRDQPSQRWYGHLVILAVLEHTPALPYFMGGPMSPGGLLRTACGPTSSRSRKTESNGFSGVPVGGAHIKKKFLLPSGPGRTPMVYFCRAGRY